MRTPPWTASVLVLSLGAPLLGCNLVSSTKVDASAAAAANGKSGGVSGVAYSLPKGQVLLVARRGPVDPAALNTAVADAHAALSKAAQALAAATKPDASGKAPGPASPAVVAARAAYDAAGAAVEAAKANLERLAPARGGARQPVQQEVVTLTALPFAPDPAARYVASFHHMPWRADDLRLSVSGTTGLLTSSTLVSEDQTPAVVQSIASPVISLGLGVPAPGDVARAPPPFLPTVGRGAPPNAPSGACPSARLRILSGQGVRSDVGDRSRRRG